MLANVLSLTSGVVVSRLLGWFRSCAVALLQADVDATEIRDYPDHASVTTTNCHINTNLWKTLAFLQTL
jgi:hypothetical protein